jgi:small GTP-binding protein
MSSSIPGDPDTIKLTTIGDTCVGKTCLITALVNRDFDATARPTIGVAYETLEFQGANIRLHMYDTAGQEQYAKLTNGYLRQSQISLVCFDVTSRETFKHLPNWIAKLREECSSFPFVVLVGTKSDLKKDGNWISDQDIQEFCESQGLVDYFETSALSKEGIEALKERIEQLARKARDERPIGGVVDPKVKPPEEGPEKKGCCK